MIIKTVWSPSTDDFDRMVNSSLAEGYKLRVRDVRELIKGQPGLYAEMEKPEGAESGEALNALLTLKQVCKDQESCKDCPLAPYIGECVCDIREPETWALPE